MVGPVSSLTKHPHSVDLKCKMAMNAVELPIELVSRKSTSHTAPNPAVRELIGVNSFSCNLRFSRQDVDP